MYDPNQPPTGPQKPPNIILGFVSLALGVCGVFGMIPTIIFTLCAIIPIGFGIAALVVGFLARGRAKRDPTNYGGAGLALAGIIAGGISVVAPILFIVLFLIIYIGMIGSGQLSR